MIRWALALLAFLASSGLAGAEAPVEIGYVENFEGKAVDYKLLREGKPQEFSVLAPIMNGDVIEVDNPTGKVTLRMVNGPDPLVISQENRGRPITATAPHKSFWSSILTTTAKAVDVFDREDREQVAASIRGPRAVEFSAPLFAGPQVILAGTRPLAIGWVSPDVTQIRITAKSGAALALGKGAGSLWISPPLDLKAGDYKIEFASSGGGASQMLHVIPASASPTRPKELDEAALPQELRAAAAAVWLASMDKKFGLEALQSVAPIAKTSRAARLLTLALIRGRDVGGPR